jgi:hypothetical protein
MEPACNAKITLTPMEIKGIASQTHAQPISKFCFSTVNARIVHHTSTQTPKARHASRILATQQPMRSTGRMAVAQFALIITTPAMINVFKTNATYLQSTSQSQESAWLVANTLMQMILARHVSQMCAKKLLKF